MGKVKSLIDQRETG